MHEASLFIQPFGDAVTASILIKEIRENQKWIKEKRDSWTRNEQVKTETQAQAWVLRWTEQDAKRKERFADKSDMKRRYVGIYISDWCKRKKKCTQMRENGGKQSFYITKGNKANAKFHSQGRVKQKSRSVLGLEYQI